MPAASYEKLGQPPAAKRFLGLPAEDYTNLVKESANL